MNGPQLTVELETGDKGQDELDTCRICRGDGIPEEPLFFPCKCSGSIKFVHQECLMEWLSHSQKKHCELCKTPFRFTKLYSPDMPKQVPTTLFLRTAAIHLAQALVRWSRAVLVMSVWAVWLPWSMRFVWWGLFWIGDGGWARNIEALKQGLDIEEAARNLTSAAKNETVSSESSSIPRLLQLPFAKEFFSLLGLVNDTGAHNLSSANAISPNATDPATLPATHASLLSGLSIFHDLTPNPALNKFIIDTAEGQVITLSVVTGFILVFLIREWVVQQQPALNLRQIDERGIDLAVNDEVAALPETENHDQRAPETAVLPTLHGDDARANSISAASITFAPENMEPLEPSLEEIEAWIVDLSKRQRAIDHLSREDFSEWHGDPADLEHARELLGCTRRAYHTFKDRLRSARDRDDQAEARSLLRRLLRLYEAVTFLPWKDDSEFGEIVNMAKGLFELEEFAKSINVSIDGEITPQLGSPSSESLLDSTQIISTLNDSASSQSVLTRPDQRPAMPARVQSSIATEIRRELEEAEEAVHSTTSSPRSEEDQDSVNTSTRPAGRTWSFTDIPRRDIQEHSSALASNERRSDSRDTAHEDNAPASLPPLRRKQKAQALSAEYMGSASDTALGQSNDISEVGSVPLQVRASTDSANASGPASETSIHHLADLSSSTDPTWLNDHASQTSFETPPLSAHVGGSSSGRNPEGSTSDDSGHALPESLLAGENLETLVADKTISERLLDWIFGDSVPPLSPPRQEGYEERVVQDPAAEAPFVPFNQGHMHHPQNHDERNEEHDGVLGARQDIAAGQAANLGNDAEAVEEAEDLEGILELVGMQGPLAGLFQNAVFAAVLVSATVTSAILFPYMCGKLVFLILANPASAINLPVQVITSLTNFMIDFLIFAGCSLFSFVDWAINAVLSPLVWLSPVLTTTISMRHLGKLSGRLADAALLRIAESMFVSGSESDKMPVTLDSLIALRILQSQFQNALGKIENGYDELFQYLAALSTLSTSGLVHETFAITDAIRNYIIVDFNRTVFLLKSFLNSLRSGTVVISISNPVANSISGLAGVEWTINDRLVAILTGYVLLAFAGTLYIRRGSPFATSEQGRKVEGIIRDLFEQSAGVSKVIFIIGIEMLVFPLYCGFLLDIAMLPLFQGSSISSRVNFTLGSPYTSAFFHWFIGTCYMFHFALFVSMCRKIFRKGVLYFIRDPDDPDFHPVRDVLERSVSSQLRKIGFSAIVYGALVILCMGSVVWAVACGISGVFPIRWKLRTPYLGFPIDILLYNVLAPLAVHFLRPSKGLHKIYEWWFRQTARLLRLSHFLFNEERETERGTISTGNRITEDGRFVQVPASDSVRIPRGRNVFLEVDEQNDQIDHDAEPLETDESHGRQNTQFLKIWIPPLFQVRIGLFVFLMWALTAALGLFATVLPLLIGRKFLSLVIGRDFISLFETGEMPVNDLYAYFLGVCPLIAVLYSKAATARAWAFVKNQNLQVARTLTTAICKVASKAFRTVYTYGALLLFVPTLLALLLEFYFILPLQSYTNGQSRPAAPHTIHLLQDWTLGLMYMRIIIRLALWDADSRPARALKAIVADGWLDPNIRLATRCFLLPLTVATMFALGLPSGFGYILGRALPNLTTSKILVERFPQLAPSNVGALQIALVRFSYPFTLWVATVGWSVYILGKAAGRWRMRIRDEIYLIGERLHNFGEGRPGPGATAFRPGTMASS